MHARARTAATRWLVCCGNRYSVALPATRMSMTPSACGTIRRCAGSSAAKPSWAVQLRRARLAALRRNGLLQTRTFLLLPTCPANGSTLCMAADHPAATHGEQENSVWNGHYACTCYHPLFVFNQFGDLERFALRPGNVHSADGWKDVLDPVVQRYRGKVTRIYFPADAAFAMPEVYEILEAERIKYAIRL